MQRDAEVKKNTFKKRKCRKSQHTYNHSTREWEAGVSGVQGYPQLQSRFEASLGYETISKYQKEMGVGGVESR